jgi:hypothetical protein
MNLTLSLRGPDLVEIARALAARGLLPTGLPVRLTCDEVALGSRDAWLEPFAGRAKSELRAAWQDDSFFMLSRGVGLVKLDRRVFDLDLRKLVDDLASVPFETAVFAARRFAGFRGPRPEGFWHGKGLTGGHYPAGWGLALRGQGHRHLVSRRFVTHGGPWRVLTGANDTTVFQFHDLAAADPVAAWAQAQPCVERLTYQPELPTCGLLDESEGASPVEGGRYDPSAAKLWIIAGQRTISPRVMREAAEERFNGRLKTERGRPLQSIGFVFPSEARARLHLHDLWLRDLECYYEAGGRRVRLDDGHQPAAPTPPAWIAQAEAAEKQPPSPKAPPDPRPSPPRETRPAKPKAVGAPRPTEDTPKSPPISAFAEKPYAPEMKRSDPRSAALATAIASVSSTLSDPAKKQLGEVAFAIAKLGTGGARVEYAGVRETEMYFSASLLKVALLYASFELVARVNKLAPFVKPGTGPDPVKDFFTGVAHNLHKEIASRVDFIPAGKWQEVAYAEVLTATRGTSGTYSVALRKDHREDLERIFSHQNQDDAARGCVRRLGFSYVNGALDAAGFLSVKHKTGVWMATDYLPDGVAHGWPSQYVPVSTGGKSSVAMTALAMAHLLTSMHREDLVDPDSSRAMKGIYAKGSAWLKLTSAPAPMSFTIMGAKVGHLKSDDAKVGVVKSEAAFLKRTSDGTPFVAVWQNLAEGPNNDDTLPVYRVIDEVLKTWP